ncbi:MAG: heme-binding domain-containing protein [Bacteroidia bacterium]|nr:heme-binding domain-containing protein [Bacteroidia bacterium]
MKNPVKSILKKVLIVLIFALALLQLYRPTKNIATEVSVNAIGQHYDVPETVDKLLRTSCYDCHSNNTVYPWYSNVQPVALFLDNHIRDGKKHLNFDEFNTYSAERKQKKFKEIAEEIEEGEMPMTSYTLIHQNAKLSVADKKLLVDWAKEMMKK